MAAGSEVVVMVTGVATTMLKALVALLLPAAVTIAVKLKVPLAVGVPLMTPVLLRVRPVGRAPDAMVQV